jgi:cysteine synthase A
MEEKNILKTTGNTPLIKIGRIYAKLETTNPSGSIKDRMAKYIIEKAEERGKLNFGYTIIEATSGNTGISLVMISAIKGYKFIAVMPKNISKTKQKTIKLFGGKVVLVPATTEEAAIKKANELVKRYKKIWLPKQFENLDNVEAHRKGLGQEILKQVPKIDAFVAGIGTGGTLTGVSMALKEKFPDVKIFGVQPVESPHKIEGLIDKKETFPKILNLNLIQGLIRIKSTDAIKMAKRLIKKEGLLVGISSGANVLAALKLSKKYKNVVTVLPDRAERYSDLW